MVHKMHMASLCVLLCIHGSVAQQYFNAGTVAVYPQNHESDNSSIHLSPVFFEKVVYSDDKEEKNDFFHDHPAFASKEWKNLMEEDVPSGVDVKINMNTGKREFRLAEDDINGTTVIRKPRKLIYANTSEFSFEDLKNALKSLKKVDEAKKKKRAKKEENIVFTKESLKKMLKNYTHSDIKDKMAILKELEHLVHQYSVAADFVKIGGVHLLLPDLLSRNPEIQSFVALVLGSALQGNPPVQQAVFKTEAMLQLLLAVHSSNSTEVKSRSLYALSNLIRHYPEAQLKFVKLGGFFMLSELFHPGSSLKLKLKVVDLLHDLASERQHIDDDDDEHEDDLRSEGSYQSFSMDSVVKENGYCTYIPRLIYVPEYDAQERAIKAMSVLTEPCKDEFSTVLDRLRVLAEDYRMALLEEFSAYMKVHKSLKDLETSDLYFLGLFSCVKELIQALEFRPSVALT